MNTWRRISPPGTAAVAIFALTGDVQRLSLRDRCDRPAEWPGPGCSRLVRLGHAGYILDEALVVGTTDGAELHVHGGTGTCDGITRWLDAEGFLPTKADHIRVPSCLRHARALLSAHHGPLAALRRLAETAAAKGDFTLPASPALQSDVERSLRCRVLARSFTTAPVVALVGCPNAGKSSLFNRLVGTERALVAPEAGTTRDVVRVQILLSGALVEVHDCAGESAEIAGGMPADLLVHLLTEADEAAWPLQPEQRMLRVLGKADLRSGSSGPAISSHTGSGLRDLMREMAVALGLDAPAEDDLWAPADTRISEWLNCRDSGSRPVGVACVGHPASSAR